MIYRNWAQGKYELQHATTRLTVHGFHHKIRRTKFIYTPEFHLYRYRVIESVHDFKRYTMKEKLLHQRTVNHAHCADYDYYFIIVISRAQW